MSGGMKSQTQLQLFPPSPVSMCDLDCFRRLFRQYISEVAGHDDTVPATLPLRTEISMGVDSAGYCTWRTAANNPAVAAVVKEEVAAAVARLKRLRDETLRHFAEVRKEYDASSKGEVGRHD